MFPNTVSLVNPEFCCVGFVKTLSYLFFHIYVPWKSLCTNLKAEVVVESIHIHHEVKGPHSPQLCDWKSLVFVGLEVVM